MKKIFEYFLVYICLVVIFSFIMVGTYLLPNNRIRGHVEESLQLLNSEGIGYSPFFQQGGATLDAHTDALILNIALNKGMNKSNIKNAFENSFYEDSTRQGISSLNEAVQDNIVNNHEYSRYWHGIQFIIRPLLIFFNYAEIRYILMLVVFILLGIVFSLISKELGIRYSIVFAITITLMFVILIPVSIQYSSIFIISLISMIFVMLLKKTNKQDYFGILFFIIGALSTFFDLLTYPLITLGFSVVLVAIMQSQEEKSLINQILNILKLGVLWSLGYCILFFTKWVIASIVLNRNAISLAIEQLLFRVNGNEIYKVNRVEMLKGNFDYFFIPTARYIMALIGLIWSVAFIMLKKNIKQCKCVVGLICIAAVPYVWYITFAGHSSIHSWFTNKIQSISVFAILSAMAYTIDINKILRRIK